MEQFHAHFLAESQDALSAIEAELLKLLSEADHGERLATVFRMAHSIKGGAGMCGFTQIASFTHSLETLLDALRSGRAALDARTSDALLQSVDVLRDLLANAAGAGHGDSLRHDAVQAELVALVLESGGQAPAVPPVSLNPSAAVAASAQQQWNIRFESGPQLLLNGIDPLQLFADLATLGTLQVQADLGKLPSLRSLDTQTCHLAWDLLLSTAAPMESIELVLEWAANDCRYELTPVQHTAASVLVKADSAAKTAAAPSPADKPSARVTVDKLDEILRLAGELVMQQAQVQRIAAQWQGATADVLHAALHTVDARIHDLQTAVMRTRLSPVSTVFAPFGRLVRDLAGPLGKQIRVSINGERTEMDKSLLEKIADPLLHLVRNCVDHGIESPQERLAAGKPAEGEIRLYAAHRGGSVTIEVSDDGKGLDTQRVLNKAISRGLAAADAQLTLEQIINLIFLPGFSTADVTTELSGRGVGMDVVRRKVLEMGGTINVSSHPGRGTCFTMSLPLSTSVIDGITVACADELYIVPLTALVECLPWSQVQGNAMAEQQNLLPYGGQYIPVLHLDSLLFDQQPSPVREDSVLVILEDGDCRAALRVDAVVDRQPIVLKSIDNGYGHVDGIGATAVLADGRSVARILDVPSLVRLSGARQQRRRIA